MPSDAVSGMAQPGHLKTKNMASLGAKFHTAASTAQVLPPAIPAGDLQQSFSSGTMGASGTTTHICPVIKLGNVSRGPVQCLAQGKHSTNQHHQEAELQITVFFRPTTLSDGFHISFYVGHLGCTQ